jgi:2-hydroxychromene-2-carboxylate isomerase
LQYEPHFYVDGVAETDTFLASPYSYFALTYLRKQRELLKQYGVEVEFHPIFLGGINVGSGNKPPWTLPAKANYGAYDLKRAIKWFGTKKLQAAPFFPILSILVSTFPSHLLKPHLIAPQAPTLHALRER